MTEWERIRNKYVGELFDCKNSMNGRYNSRRTWYPLKKG